MNKVLILLFAISLSSNNYSMIQDMYCKGKAALQKKSDERKSESLSEAKLKERLKKAHEEAKAESEKAKSLDYLLGADIYDDLFVTSPFMLFTAYKFFDSFKYMKCKSSILKEIGEEKYYEIVGNHGYPSILTTEEKHINPTQELFSKYGYKLKFMSPRVVGAIALFTYLNIGFRDEGFIDLLIKQNNYRKTAEKLDQKADYLKTISDSL